jgi:alkylhydroperoxidase family enzyme
VGRASGLSEAKLRALDDFESNAAFSELERLVLRFAAGMTATPAEVPDDVFKALRARFDEAQLVELTATVAWENHRARFNRAFEIGPDDFSGGAFCPLPMRPAAR